MFDAKFAAVRLTEPYVTLICASHSTVDLVYIYRQIMLRAFPKFWWKAKVENISPHHLIMGRRGGPGKYLCLDLVKSLKRCLAQLMSDILASCNQQ